MKSPHGASENEGYKDSQIREEAAAARNAQGLGAPFSICPKMEKVRKHKTKVHEAIYHGNVNFQNFQIRLAICLEGGI